MTRIVQVLMLLLLSLGTRALTAQEPPGGPAADSVRAAESARREALLRADTAALSRLIADEFFEISRLGTVRTRAQNIHDVQSGELRLTSIRQDSLAVRIYGDVAILTGIADNTGTFRGFPFSGKIRYMRVFVRRDGRWQAVAMEQTPMQ